MSHNKIFLAQQNEIALQHFKLVKIKAAAAEEEQQQLASKPPSLLPSMPLLTTTGDELQLKITPVSSFFWQDYSAQEIVYKKKSLRTDNIPIDIVTKNNKFETFVWHAKQDNLEKARQYGLVPAEALTQRVSDKFAVYRRKCLKRAYKGIVSNKNKEKTTIVDYAQQSIQALQHIEQCIPDASLADNTQRSQAAQHKLDTAVQNYKDTLTAFKKQVDDDNNSLSPQTDKAKLVLNQAISAKLCVQIDAIDQLTVGGELSFVKQELINITRRTQYLNQILTYQLGDLAFLRGDLHGACEEAFKTINDANEIKQRILPEHQGDYSGKNTDISIDFSYLGDDKEAIDDVLMAIIDVCTKGEATPASTKTTRATKWHATLALELRIANFFILLWNLISGIIVGIVVDFAIMFIPNVLLCLCGYEPWAAFSEKLKIEINSPIDKNSIFYQAQQAIGINTDSLWTQVAYHTARLIRTTVLDLVSGIAEGTRHISIKLWDDLCVDFQSAMLRPGVGRTIDKIVEEIYDKFSAVKQELDKYQAEGITKEECNRQFALPPYHLISDQYNDLLNAAMLGGRDFVEFFTLHIHQKHSFLGLVFTSTYLTTLTALMAPLAVQSVLGHGYVNVSKTLGTALAHGALSEGITAGFTMGKAASFALEALLHGNDSWLVKGFESLADNPADVIMITTFALTFGYFIHSLSVPGLSHLIEEELGDVEGIGFAFFGGKLAVIIIELADQGKIAPVVRDQLLAQLKKQSSYDSKKLTLIFALEEHREHMAHVTYRTRRQWFDEICQQFPADCALHTYAKDILMPKEKQSIFATTLLVIVDYIPLLIRCIASLLTAIFVQQISLTPWQELGEKIAQDLARVLNAMATLLHAVASFVRLILRGVVDVIGNEVLARIEGIINHDQAPFIASGNADISEKLDTTYQRCCENLASFFFLDQARQSGIVPDVLGVCGEPHLKV